MLSQGIVVSREAPMVRETETGSFWAGVVAVVSVTCTIGALFLPLILK
jgi:hypothetical protein